MTLMLFILYKLAGIKVTSYCDQMVLVYSKLNTSNEIVSVLLFDPVNHTDDGEYTCRSFNDPLSFIEVTTTVTVE